MTVSCDGWCGFAFEEVTALAGGFCGDGVNRKVERGDGNALEVLGGAPVGAVGECYFGENGRADGACLLHPDIGFVESRGAGLTLEGEGFGDGFCGGGVEWQDASVQRGCVDRDSNGLNGWVGEAIESEMETLPGAEFFLVGRGEGLESSAAAGAEAYRAACS